MYQYIRGHVVKMSNSERLSVYKEEEDTRIKVLTEKFNREIVQLELTSIYDIGTLVSTHLSKLSGNINNHLLILLTVYLEKLQHDMVGDLVEEYYDQLTDIHTKLKGYIYEEDLDKTGCLACVEELLLCVTLMRSYIKKNSQSV